MIRNWIKISSIIISIGLLVRPGFGQDALTLEDCLQLAFKNSRMLQVADLGAEVAVEQVAEAKAQLWPSIGLSGLYTRIGKITSFTIPMGGVSRTFQFGTPNRVNVDVKLQLPIVTWGRINSTIEMSQVGRSLAEVQRRQKKVELTEQVLRAFYAVLLNEEVVRLRQESVQRAERHLKTAQDRFQAGIVPRLELLRAEVELKNAQSAHSEALANLEKSKMFLAKVIGRDSDQVAVAGKFEFKPVRLDEAEIISKATSVRSDIQAIRLQQQMSQSQIALAKSGNKPNLFLFSGYNVVNGFDPLNPDKFVDNYNVGVQLAVPLFDGFATSHKVQQAELQQQQIKLQEQEIEDLIRLQVRQAIIALRQAEDKIKTQEENIVLAKQALQVAEQQYRDGLISSIEVLDAQHTLSQSELLRTQAIFNHVMTKLELCRAMEDFGWFAVQ
ncbi:MAG: TolC family protein [candidate division KSB1 bacterium]|nr:TolC family protein [candidate division KSB1 bacterium]